MLCESCLPFLSACSYQGLYYTDGRTFSPDRCQTCRCDSGNVTCTPPSCPNVECSDPYKPPGSCCPTCLEGEKTTPNYSVSHLQIGCFIMVVGCEYSGRRYDEGAVFSPSFNPCMNCTCLDRKVRCGPVRCPPTPNLRCSRPVALPGDCCPSFCPSKLLFHSLASYAP